MRPINVYDWIRLNQIIQYLLNSKTSDLVRDKGQIRGKRETRGESKSRLEGIERQGERARADKREWRDKGRESEQIREDRETRGENKSKRKEERDKGRD